VCGKMRVIGTKARSLPFATRTTDTPPGPDTQARLPLAVNAIDATGPECMTEIRRTTFWRRALTTQIRPAKQVRRSFSGAEGASLLASRPYDLRRAAVSAWLQVGAARRRLPSGLATAFYAKCITGAQDEAKQRILEATRPEYSSTASSPADERLIR
jgi:hypothetical protein